MPLWLSAASSTWRCDSSSVAQKAAPPPSANSSSSRPRRRVQHLCHLGHQLLGGEGLGHVGIGAHAQALVDIGVTALRGEHQHQRVGDLLFGAQLLADLVAALLGHHHVQQHQARALAAQQVQRLLAVTRHEHLVAGALHQVFERDDDVRLVVGDQHLVRHGLSPSCCACQGSVKKKHAPCAVSSRKPMRPPKCSTIWRLIGKPKPVPCGRCTPSPP
jgi:hypothetical protein